MAIVEAKSGPHKLPRVAASWGRAWAKLPVELDGTEVLCG